MLVLPPEPETPFPALDPLDLPDEAEVVTEPAPENDPFNGIPNIEAITTRACQRIQQCRSDMGISFGTNTVADTAIGWAQKRKNYRAAYSGDMSSRMQQVGGIFADERRNLSLNVPGRFIRLLSAKYAADLIGSRPFMQAMPANIRDKQEATESKEVERLVQDGIDESNLQSVLAESIRVALIEGERPIKLTWMKDQTQYPGPATVAVDEQGQPVKTPHGDYIYENDDILKVVVDEAGKLVRTLEPDEQGAEGEVVQLRLKKEPGYLFTADPVFQLIPDLMQTLTNWEGLYAAGLFCEDFVYPIMAPSLRDPICDIMAHSYDAFLDTVVAEYENAGYPAWRADRIQQTNALSQASQPIYLNGEQQPNDNLRPRINIHETCFRTRINPTDKHETWLFIVIDYQAQAPIYAEYLGRLKMKRPPFVLLRGLESVPGRAYGMGVYEKMWDKHLTIDALFIRASSKNASENCIDFLHNGSVEEVLDGQPMLAGCFKRYSIKGNDAAQFNQANPPYFRINLNNMNEGDFELMEKLIQSAELEFGYLTASDGQGGNDTVNGGTATAVRNIERTGNILHESSEALISGDIEEALEIVVDCLLENTDLDDLAFVKGEEALAGMNGEEIRNMTRDVRILRSKTGSAETIEINTAVKAAVLEYYSLTKAMQKKVRDQYLAILTSYRVADADDKLTEPTDEELQAEAQASTKEPPRESMTAAMKDIGVLAPSERAQFLALLGITAAPPEELLAMQQQEAQTELAAQAAKLPPTAGAQHPQPSTPQPEPAPIAQ